MGPDQDKLFKIVFEEVKRYEVTVRAPTRESAEKWADDSTEYDDVYCKVRDNYYGKMTKNKLEYDCQEIESREDFDVLVDKKGDELDAEPED